MYSLYKCCLQCILFELSAEKTTSSLLAEIVSEEAKIQLYRYTGMNIFVLDFNQQEATQP